MKQRFAKLLGGLLCMGLGSMGTKAQDMARNRDTPYYHTTSQKVNDLIDTRLDVRFDLAKSYVYGKEWITLKPHYYPTDTLQLDAKGMNIKTIGMMQHGKIKPLTFRYNDSLTLVIKLDRTYRNDEKYTLFIDYTAMPDKLHDKPGFKLDGKGLYFVNPRGEDTSKPTQIWTQGEAESSSCWFPTIDKPNQKTTEEISITVPSKYVTLSNGLLITQKNNTDGTRTDTWRQLLPHAPYLFMLAVGDFKIFKDKWRNKAVDYYLEPAYAPYAKQLFGQTPEMMEFFSQALGVDFPWDKYAQVVVRDFPLGAMENTSATLHGDYVQKTPWDLIDDPNGAGGTTIAHELFHQWFGDLVTCESWSNETLNESFAVFGEKYWNEKKYGKDDGDAKRYDEMQAYLRNATAASQPLVPFVFTDNEGINGANIYDKGGIVLNMLRNYLGDEAFFKGLGLYLKTHAYKNAEVQDLRLAMEEVSGRDLNWFFNQWYYGAGHPVLDVTSQWNEALHQETVIINQQQAGPAFQWPLAVDFYVKDKVVRAQVWMKQHQDTLVIPLATKPDLVNVDADKVLLCKLTDHKTLEELYFQYQHAPFYLDRLEAIQAATGQQGQPAGIAILTAALKDKYYGLRIRAINAIKTDTLDRAATILPLLAGMASNDTNYLVRAAAITVLGKTGRKDYTALYQSSIASPSYTVKGAALLALNSVDPAAAFTLAKHLETDGKGKLGQAIVYTYAANGSDEQWPFIMNAFNKGSVQVKFDLLRGGMSQLMVRLKNKQYTAEGIHAMERLGIGYKRYGIATKLIVSLEQVGSGLRSQGDTTTAGIADEAIRHINEAK
ncbi:aminopeptidase N [Chitinophaga costaii]|uniref:Aminopeptidase N n=1 Tax=Chitinophaga costaii TaxID=1335309 RepID=A0A1C4FY24_9BACT|nr:M1 family metallopeptidase [Chitinophaga costaii]PUZ20906.1 peptidase M1 [Chitinophaga costaii]SCC60786.1 aminopeptidase N [Chitinophaga costaii]